MKNLNNEYESNEEINNKIYFKLYICTTYSSKYITHKNYRELDITDSYTVAFPNAYYIKIYKIQLFNEKNEEI
ncbi:hypothetical protein IKS57_03205, partial [bacterium]|nr:hypothetical protein [bacterium]